MTDTAPRANIVNRSELGDGGTIPPGTPIPAPTPRPEHRLIVVDPELTPRFRPADLRVIQALTGRGLIAMAAGDDEADRMQALAFCALRRDNPDTATKDLWQATEQADIEMGDVGPTLPTSSPSVTIGTGSPGSAVSGG